MKRRILLLEDDGSLAYGLEYLLLKNGFETEIAAGAEEAKKLLKEKSYDLALLDIALPDGTGFEVCEFIRKKSDLPIIFITACDEETDVIRGLDMGGDDYITKPFKTGELLSRINAVLRRVGTKRGTGELKSGNIKIDLEGLVVTKNGEPMELTSTEYRLLSLLIRNTGRTVTRSKILEALWDIDGSFVDDNTLSVYIRRLREKVEDDPSQPERLVTVRGFGYKWRKD